MRTFDYLTKAQELLTPDIVALLTSLHEYRGKQELFSRTKPEVLERLVSVAKIQSTDASNRIEGIYTSDERLKKIVLDKTMPKSRSEKEIAGYRDVLSTIHESHPYIPVTATSILQLHRDLYKFTGANHGGKFKIADNEIAEILPDGKKQTRFTPVPAWQTPESIEAICSAYNEAKKDDSVDPLLYIPIFILDFLCIHPFTDGNGRMSRLFTLLLLYNENYLVGKYISLERIINDSKESYYEALQNSSHGWHEDNNDYSAFVSYYLGMMLSAYREFEDRISLVSNKEMSKPEMIAFTIKNSYGKITKQEILGSCPGVSLVTVQRTLKQLQESNDIIKIGGGRYTSYVWNREKDQ